MELKKKTANGVSSRVKNEEIKYRDYKRCLIEDEIMYHKMVRIAHKHHQLETEEKLKKSLSPYNDKRWIKKNGEEFETYSFGHWRLTGKYKYNLYVKNIYLYIFIFTDGELEKGELETVLAELIEEANTSEKSE